jgi:hypothetical protein
MRFSMHKTCISALPTLVVLAPLHGQDTWAAFLDKVRDAREGQPTWRLVLRPEDADPSWLQDAWIRRLVGTQEFRIEGLSKPVAKDLSAVKGWKQEARWLLLGPEATQQKEGPGRPTGEQLLNDLRAMGFAPRWERRAAFLKEHPDHGPARLEEAEESLTWGLNRLGAVAARSGITVLASALRAPTPDATALVLVDSAFKEGEAALRRYQELPLWWDRGLGSSRRILRLFSGRMPAGLEEVAEALRDRALEELKREPSDDELWTLWGELVAVTRQDPRPALAGVVPAPGQAWPPDDLVTTLFNAFAERADWAGALEAMDALAGAATREPVDEEEWRGARTGLALVEVQRARILAKQERWEDSAAAVARARDLAGRRWRGFLPALVRRGIPEATQERASLFAASLDNDPPADPPPPPVGKLRVLCLGPWDPAWAALAQAPEFAPWSPAELVVERAAPDLERALRERHHWVGPRWVLLRGENLLASGAATPLPRELAHRMEAEAPSKLQRLDNFLQHHPDHRSARRLRLNLLNGRMPNKHLESLLAEDARLLRARLKPMEGWIPDPGLWQWAAQKALPELEQDLERWPDRPDLWRAWLSWSRLHPRTPSPLALARRLPVWGSEATWSARLPAEVHKAVAEEFRAQGRFEDMRQWFQDAWDGVDKRMLRRFPAAGPPWIQEQRKTLREGILEPLRESLVALRRDAELLALDREVSGWIGVKP